MSDGEQQIDHKETEPKNPTQSPPQPKKAPKSPPKSHQRQKSNGQDQKNDGGDQVQEQEEIEIERRVLVYLSRLKTPIEKFIKEERAIHQEIKESSRLKSQAEEEELEDIDFVVLPGEREKKQREIDEKKAEAAREAEEQLASQGGEDPRKSDDRLTNSQFEKSGIDNNNSDSIINPQTGMEDNTDVEEEVPIKRLEHLYPRREIVKNKLVIDFSEHQSELDNLINKNNFQVSFWVNFRKIEFKNNSNFIFYFRK